MVTKLMRTKCDNQQEEEQIRGRSVRSHPQSKRERWIPLPMLKKKHITNESYSKNKRWEKNERIDLRWRRNKRRWRNQTRHF